jgi:hypothetical protein
MYILVYINKFMSMKPNPKEINIILNILKGAQFEFLPRAPFYIDTPPSGQGMFTSYGTATATNDRHRSLNSSEDILSAR